MIHFKLENRFVLEKKSKQNVLAVFFQAERTLNLLFSSKISAFSGRKT